MPTVVVLGREADDARHVCGALERAGADVTFTCERAGVLEADGLVLLGTGTFASVMDHLRQVDGPLLIERRLCGGRPVLGIAAGHHVLFESCATEEAEGLGQWPGRVDLLDVSTVGVLGWCRINPPSDSTLFAGVEDEEFYFSNSYAATTDPASSMTLGPTRLPRTAWVRHDNMRVVAAVENGPLCGVQFHPEDCGQAGHTLLRNWVCSL